MTNIFNLNQVVSKNKYNKGVAATVDMMLLILKARPVIGLAL